MKRVILMVALTLWVSLALKIDQKLSKGAP